MEQFAALIDALVYTRSRNEKLRLIAEYLRATPDPDRGWALAALSGDLQRDLAILAEAAPGSRAAELASIRYAERRALESAARWFDAQLELPASSVEYYQERRLRSLNLDPIETAEDLDALRATGRAYSDNDW